MTTFIKFIESREMMLYAACISMLAAASAAFMPSDYILPEARLAATIFMLLFTFAFIWLYYSFNEPKKKVTAKTLTIIPQFVDSLLNDKYTEKDTIRPSYCYLHGELENLVGYDIFYILRDDLSEKDIDDTWLSDEFKPGLHPAKFEDKECTFFYWKCELNRPHGLVVLNTDTVGYEDALKKYTRNQKQI